MEIELFISFRAGAQSFTALKAPPPPTKTSNFQHAVLPSGWDRTFFCGKKKKQKGRERGKERKLSELPISACWSDGVYRMYDQTQDVPPTHPIPLIPSLIPYFPSSSHSIHKIRALPSTRQTVIEILESENELRPARAWPQYLHETGLYHRRLTISCQPQFEPLIL